MRNFMIRFAATAFIAFPCFGKCDNPGTNRKGPENQKHFEVEAIPDSVTALFKSDLTLFATELSSWRARCRTTFEKTSIEKGEALIAITELKFLVNLSVPKSKVDSRDPKEIQVQLALDCAQKSITFHPRQTVLLVAKLLGKYRKRMQAIDDSEFEFGIPFGVTEAELEAILRQRKAILDDIRFQNELATLTPRLLENLLSLVWRAFPEPNSDTQKPLVDIICKLGALTDLERKRLVEHDEFFSHIPAANFVELNVAF